MDLWLGPESRKEGSPAETSLRQVTFWSSDLWCISSPEGRRILLKKNRGSLAGTRKQKEGSPAETSASGDILILAASHQQKEGGYCCRILTGLRYIFNTGFKGTNYFSILCIPYYLCLLHPPPPPPPAACYLALQLASV